VSGERWSWRIDGNCEHVAFSVHVLFRYVKFDTFHPAVEKGLPVTRVISRYTLQKLLAEACEKIAGKELILNDTVVENFEEKVACFSLFQYYLLRLRSSSK
jgi:hypothetical protein